MVPLAAWCDDVLWCLCLGSARPWIFGWYVLVMHNVSMASWLSLRFDQAWWILLWDTYGGLPPILHDVLDFDVMLCVDSMIDVAMMHYCDTWDFGDGSNGFMLLLYNVFSYVLHIVA